MFLKEGQGEGGRMNGDDEQGYGLWMARGEWVGIKGGSPPFLPTLLTVQYIDIKFSIPSTSSQGVAPVG